MGLAICRRLVADGWHVVTASRHKSSELASLLDASNGRVEHYTVDFAQRQAVSLLCEQAKLLDGVDGFVANAAVATEGLLTLASQTAIEDCLRVNLLASILLARAVIKGMLKRGGSLVFISSVAARIGLSGLTTYSATKGGLLSFSKALAREYGGRGIRSNVILPGFLETEMSRSLSKADQTRAIRRTALKRLGRVDDVVGCVGFLLSEEASYITGGEFVIDGGLSA